MARDLFVYDGGELEFLFDQEGGNSGTASTVNVYLELEKSGF